MAVERLSEEWGCFNYKKWSGVKVGVDGTPQWLWSLVDWEREFDGFCVFGGFQNVAWWEWRNGKEWWKSMKERKKLKKNKEAVWREGLSSYLKDCDTWENENGLHGEWMNKLVGEMFWVTIVDFGRKIVIKYSRFVII